MYMYDVKFYIMLYLCQLFQAYTCKMNSQSHFLMSVRPMVSYLNGNSTVTKQCDWLIWVFMGLDWFRVKLFECHCTVTVP